MPHALVIIETPSRSPGVVANYQAMIANIHHQYPNSDSVVHLADNCFKIDLSQGMVAMSYIIDESHRSGFKSHTVISKDPFQLITTLGNED